MSKFQNVVIGEPLVNPSELLSNGDSTDWNNEKKQTFFTDNRYLPKILKDIGIVPSISEVKRNKPQYDINLTVPDFIVVKWGKKVIYIVVGKVVSK